MPQRLVSFLEPFIPPAIKEVIVQCLLWTRMPTRSMRLLPDFIIIGAQRAGTTSFYNYLIAHPHIVPALRKEIHFFDKHLKKGIYWYRAHFLSWPYSYFIKQTRKYNLITGEASPYYIFHPLVSQRIAQVLPRVKLIALLRNPVDRAYSHYWHEVRMGYETLSFEEAIRCELPRLQGERQRMLKDGQYRSVAHQHFSYLARGTYIDQLKAWRRFFPQEQLLILDSQDFYADPVASLGRVFEFLNVPNWESGKYKRYNRATYPPINLDTRKRLNAYFQPYNERLYEYLGTRFDWH